MKNFRDSTRAWLELARLSNAPTVVTNVLVGYVLGTLSAGSDHFDWLPFALAAAAGLVLYTAGMILNDAKDAERDTKSRPTRPPRPFPDPGCHDRPKARFTQDTQIFRSARFRRHP